MIIIEDTSELKLYNSAVALGKFDGIHKGHILLLDRLSELKKGGLTSVVCIIDMGKESILSEAERIRILEDAEVDYLVRFSFNPEFAALSPEVFVQKILVEKFHVKDIVVGTDFQFGCNRGGNVDTLNELSAKYDYHVSAIEKLQLEGETVSSTRIRTALSQGNLSVANLLLGRNYVLTGTVIHGRHLGRSIGFPTTNILPEQGKLLPKSGVYASIVHTGDHTYRAITNIGNNPSVGSGNQVTIESYVFDFVGDLYDTEIQIELIQYVRGEQKFGSIDDLKIQLERDISFVKDLKY